ncbi:MAG TPA: MFS transporter [Chloroflexi bacterium]|jgi:DHA1 family multidrug resistance protein-like MFS transporter|nr:MFS transporter [Chloroflexota bacterium]
MTARDNTQADDLSVQTASLPGRNRILLAMMAQVFMVSLGIGLVGPIMPLYAQSFGVGAAMVGGLVTAFGIARIIVNVPVGRLVEKIGRKPLLVGGPLLTSTAALLMGLSTQFEHLIFWRFLQGLGSAAQMTAAMVCLADITTSENRGRIMSRYQGSMLVGASFGPTLGGLVGEHFGFRAPFFVYSALTFSAVIWALLVVPETRRYTQLKVQTGRNEAGTSRKDQSGQAPDRPFTAMSLFRDPNFWLVSLVSLTIFFTRTGSRNTVLPLYGNSVLGLSAGQVGFTFTLTAIFNLLTVNLSGSLCDRYGRKAVIAPACVLSGLSLICFSLSPNYTYFLLSAGLLGIGTGLAGPAPAAYVTDLAGPGNYGLAMGIFRTFSDVGISIGPLFLGALSDQFGYMMALRVNAIMFAGAGLAFGLLAKETLVRDRGAQPARAQPGGIAGGSRVS